MVPPVLASGEDVRLVTEGAFIRMELLCNNVVPLDVETRLRGTVVCLDEMALRSPERRPVRDSAAFAVLAHARSAVSIMIVVSFEFLICLTPLTLIMAHTATHVKEGRLRAVRDIV